MIKIFHGNNRSTHENFQRWRRTHSNGFHMSESKLGVFVAHWTQDKRESEIGRGCTHSGGSANAYLEDKGGSYTEARKVCSESFGELKNWCVQQGFQIKTCSHCDTRKFPFPYSDVTEAVEIKFKPSQIHSDVNLKFWFMKGTPDNEWDEMQVPGKVWTWSTKRPPKDWQIGDRIFCYESSPSKKVVGLAELSQLNSRESKDGRTFYDVKFLTRRLAYMPDIDALRLTPGLENAIFLKSGPATTVLPVRDEEAMAIFAMLSTRNPEINQVWPDMVHNLDEPNIAHQAGDDFGVEGDRRLVTHYRVERNSKLIDEKRRRVLTKTGALKCEVCNFDFNETYGLLGNDFCEVHHTNPLAENAGPVKTRLADLAIVCANCHRMLHRGLNLVGIDELKTKLSLD